MIFLNLLIEHFAAYLKSIKYKYPSPSYNKLKYEQTNPISLFYVINR